MFTWKKLHWIIKYYLNERLQSTKFNHLSIHAFLLIHPLLILQDSTLSIPLLKKNSSEIDSEWESRVHAGQSKISVHKTYLRSGVKMDCDNASFSIQKPLNFNLNKTPLIQWEWIAYSLSENGDLRDNNRNDQVVQILFLFERGVFGYKALSYVWDSNAPVGFVAIEKWNFLLYRIDVKVIVVDSGKKNLNHWVKHERNIINDYKTLYNESPKKLVGVRLQTNCQHTTSTSSGEFNLIQFKSL